MSADVVQPVVLDTTVLSNFSCSEAVDQLVALLDRPGTVAAVQSELEQGYSQQYDFLGNALDHIGDGIVILDIADTENGDQADVRDRLDRGEADSLLAAVQHGGTLATDDLAARRLASELGVPVTGSIGILAVGVERETIEMATANEWLVDWREKRGYYAPIDRIEELFEES